MRARPSLLVASLLLAAPLVAAGCAAPTGERTSADVVEVVEPAGRPNAWSFAPAEISVAKGTAVRFVNGGSEFHTVTADAVGRPFDLALEGGHTGTITFATVGTFAYHCGVHPQMKGVIRVCDGTCG